MVDAGVVGEADLDVRQVDERLHQGVAAGPVVAGAPCEEVRAIRRMPCSAMTVRVSGRRRS
jgi:hypothetical protein